MTSEELSRIFRERYHSAAHRQVATSIHLFGIEYADALQGHSIKEICTMADVPVSYATEVYKGMKLAKFVVPQ